MTGQEWEARGNFITVNNRSLFVIDEGSKNEEVLIISHGYPSSSFDYWKVLPLLTERYRVIIHDHLGFGLSGKPVDYSYSLIDQADIALALWQQMGIKEAHLLGHDYGTSVVCEIVAKWNNGFRPIHLKSVCIGNGSMLIDMAKLLFSQKLLMNKKTGPILTKLSSLSYFQYNMKKLWWDKSKYDANDIKTLYEMAFSDEARVVFPTVSRYNLERNKFYHRWLTNGLYKTELPVHIYWADKDPIAIIEMAHELHKNIANSTLEIIPDVGHYPMLEAPKLWTKAIFTSL